MFYVHLWSAERMSFNPGVSVTTNSPEESPYYNWWSRRDRYTQSSGGQTTMRAICLVLMPTTCLMQLPFLYFTNTHSVKNRSTLKKNTYWTVLHIRCRHHHCVWINFRGNRSIETLFNRLILEIWHGFNKETYAISSDLIFPVECIWLHWLWYIN